MMSGGMMGGMGLWMVLWGLFVLALFVLVVVGIVWLLRTMGAARQAFGRGREEPPLAHLERRYARGEIDRDEFLQRREDLAPH
ncbi:MAG: SHOCT domain-containing protein [Egibacteraceae bacterium]